MATKRRTNRPRPKVPYRVWITGWGYRDSDPAVTWILSTDQYPTKRAVASRIQDMLTTWLQEEADYYEEDVGAIEDRVVGFGPFLESYIKVVKDLRSPERKEIETDFNFYGEAFIPRE